jgi:hypothetical protein
MNVKFLAKESPAHPWRGLNHADNDPKITIVCFSFIARKTFVTLDVYHCFKLYNNTISIDKYIKNYLALPYPFWYHQLPMGKRTCCILVDNYRVTRRPSHFLRCKTDIILLSSRKVTLLSKYWK